MSDTGEEGDVIATINETVEGLHVIGIVALTLARVPGPSPEEIRGIREPEADSDWMNTEWRSV